MNTIITRGIPRNTNWTSNPFAHSATGQGPKGAENCAKIAGVTVDTRRAVKMAEETKISWTATDGKPGATFNPWMGCERISEGCKHCYAETFVSGRMGLPLWGPVRSTERQRTSLANWKKPLAWDRTAQREGRRIKVFCASLADVFEDNPQVASWRADLFRLIERTTHLDWLLLTKRADRMAALAREAGWRDSWPDNVWAGTTVENQDKADKRIPDLLKVPARVRFLSCEPLLEQVSLETIPANVPPLPGMPGWWDYFNALDGIGYNQDGYDESGRASFPRLSWVICGGENSRPARSFDLGWARSLRDQCRAAGVPFFFKQAGSNPVVYATGERPRYKDKAGADMNEWPEDLRVQEFPR